MNIGFSKGAKFSSENASLEIVDLDAQLEEEHEFEEEELPKIIELTEDELKSELEESYQEGYKKGLSDHSSQFEMQVQDEVNKITGLYKHFDQAQMTFFDHLERQFIDLVFKVSKKIIQTELSENQKIFENIITRSLNKLKDGRKFQIHLSEQDFSRLKLHDFKDRTTLSSQAELEVIKKENLAESHFIIETDAGNLSFNIEEQLAQLKGDSGNV
jgi:flagellar biosynthesis/type III secretory pathway protein FliH